jgi:hypothetical protein
MKRKNEEKEEIVNWLYNVYIGDGVDADNLVDWMIHYYKWLQEYVNNLEENIKKVMYGVDKEDVKEICNETKFLYYISKYFSDLERKIKTELGDEFEKRVYDREKHEWVSKKIKFKFEII